MVVTYQVPTPASFNFVKPKEWTRWIRRFEHFRKASGLETKEGGVQVNTLLYSMGSEADDILLSFRLSEEDSINYDVVKGKFDAHFIKKRNVIYERAKFNMCHQGKEESVDSFVTTLYQLAVHCNYQALHDEMIRDRLVVGLRDAKLSEKLQLDPDLTLETAITKTRQSEAVHKQQPLLRGNKEKEKEEIPVGAVKSKTSPHQQQARQQRGKKKTSNVCTRCGKAPWHDRQQCPAREDKCKACGKLGHYRLMCRSPGKVREVHQGEEEAAFLGAVSEHSSCKWEVIVSLNGVPVKMKIDTGAEVTVISKAVHEAVGSPPLQKADRILKGPSNK